MSEVVFILGAGASAEAGAPVVANFLNKADKLRKGSKLGNFQQDFDLVFDAISKLQAVHSKAQLDLDNIESVFAAFEMGILTNGLPGIPVENIEALLISIKKLILKTIESTVKYPVRDKVVCPNDSYDSFAELVNKLTMEGQSCSIITFNYDYALEYALDCHRIPADYCLSDTSKEGVIPLMKLHGSLNWGSCSKCDEIIPWDIGDYMRRSNVGLVVSTGIDEISINLGSNLPKSALKHCQETVKPDPVIVPPTWNKTVYQQQLKRVWNRAALELSTAENIFVSGYSLNESDLFFRYLFALGSVGKTRIKRFWVFDIDDEGEVDERFRKLIGGGTGSSYRYESTNFGRAIYSIESALSS